MTSACCSILRSRFPISWKKSKLDGVAVRIGTPNLHGFQWTTTMGHTRARYFPPETGGLVFNGDVGRRLGFPHRPRSGVPADHQSALPTWQHWAVDLIHLAVRQRTSGRRGWQPGRCARVNRRAAGRHRILLRERPSDHRHSAHGRPMYPHELRRHQAGDSRAGHRK